MKKKKYVIPSSAQLTAISKKIVGLQTLISARKTYRKYRKRALERLGNKCVKCDYDDVRALVIDHIKGGGNKERRAGILKFYRKLLTISEEELKKDYQCLCANCNTIKKFEEHEGYITQKEFETLVEKTKQLKRERKRLKTEWWKEQLAPYQDSNLTYRQIAAKTGMSLSSISRYMKGGLNFRNLSKNIKNILEMLSKCSATQKELAQKLNIPLSTVSRTLTFLEKEELIEYISPPPSLSSERRKGRSYNITEDGRICSSMLAIFKIRKKQETGIQKFKYIL